MSRARDLIEYRLSLNEDHPSKTFKIGNWTFKNRPPRNMGAGAQDAWSTYSIETDGDGFRDTKTDILIEVLEPDNWNIEIDRFQLSVGSFSEVKSAISKLREPFKESMFRGWDWSPH